MLITIIAYIITFVIVFLIDRADNRPHGGVDWPLVITATAILGGVGSLLLHLVTYPFCVERSWEKTAQPIVASKADTRIEGEIDGGCFYFRGRIDEVDYYFVLVKEGSVYKRKKVPAESTVISETGGTPCVVTNKMYVKSKWSHKIRLHGDPEYVREMDTIYVPVGAVSSGMKYEVF